MKRKILAISMLFLVGGGASAWAQRGTLLELDKASSPASLCGGAAAGGGSVPQPPPRCVGPCIARVTNYCARPSVVAAAGAGNVTATGTSWQSIVVSGLGNFVADRVKLETLSWLEGLIGDQLCGLTYHDLDPVTGKPVGDPKQWFAETCKIFNDVDLGKNLSTGFIATAIRTDLKHLPVALASAVFDRSSPDKNKRILAAIAAIEGVVSQFQEGDAPLEIIAGLGDQPDLRRVCRDQGAPTPECVVVVVGLSVKYFGAAASVANVADKTVLNKDEIITRVLGAGKLACDVAKVFSDDSCVPATPTLTKVPQPFRTYLDLLVGAGDVYERYEPRIRHLLEAMVALEVTVRGARDANLPSLDNIRKVLDAFRGVVDAGATVFDVDDTALVAMINGTTSVVAGTAEFAAGDYQAAGADIIAAADDLAIPIPPAAKKFLSFVMDVAGAKTSADVQQALESAAAPIGGWRLKRERFTVSVTAFGGAMGGYETPVRWNTTGVAKRNGGVAGGLFAPIGVDFSGPSLGSSAGILVSVLDVGQLTWARLTNLSDDQTMTKTDSTPETSFAQVLSPGVYLHQGLGNTPFTVGLGVSFAPELRKYTATSGQVDGDKLSTLRFGVFLAIDATIIPLWARRHDVNAK